MDILEEQILKMNGGVKKSSYTFSEVKHILSSIDVSPIVKRKPKTFKKGDVVNASGINFKMRPFVIVKKSDKGYYCIPMTSDKNDYALLPTNSRFFNGYFCSYMVIISEDLVKQNYAGILDDNRTLNKAVKLIAENFKTNFL